ncbi:MAG: tRNA dihydrouridine synthase [Minisyncoccota bacterium]
MIKGFWDNLPRPFMVLAPMADVTDVAFREIIAKYGRHGLEGGGPDVFYTQFVSCDGLCSPGREVLLHDLRYSEAERPIVAQIFGSNPDTFYETAKLLVQLGFDGIDINMGCPDRSVEKQGAGAALIKNPDRARELIRATKSGAPHVPVSVKTRVGYNKDELDRWLPQILEEEPAAVTIHARTRKELSKVSARWGDVARAVDIARGSGVCIVGNGDVGSVADGERLARDAGADGAMLGRAIFGNPWLFDRSVLSEQIPLVDRLGVMVEHTKAFEELLGGVKNFAIMKKHYKAYVSGFDGAKELRMRLMEAPDADAVARIVQDFLNLSTLGAAGYLR